MKSLIVLSAFVLAAVSTPVQADDLTDSQARATAARFQTLYGATPAFIPQTLLQVPFYSATSEFLGRYGSSTGIYFRRSIYLVNTLWLADGIDVDGPSPATLLIHEGWHAYYDLLLPRTERSALEAHWASYYSRMGISRDDAICMGDETIGNYLGNLAFAYVGAVNQYKRLKTLRDGMIRIYAQAYESKEPVGYCDERASTLAISPYEKTLALRVSGDFFPAPADLLESLKKRFP